MISKLRRDGILAELETIQTMLGEIPEDELANRMGLESRRDELAAELAAKDQEEGVARAGLIFGGAPVVGALGIDAEFAASAVAQYQTIVSTLAAFRRRGSLRGTGPIPDRKESRLHIVGTLHGSFGFELAELDARTMESRPARTPLAEDVEHATRIIAAAGESDDAFADAIADLDERVSAALRDFFGLLKQRRATLRVVAGDIDRHFDLGSIIVAAERTDAKLLAKDDVPIQGTFLGAYPTRHSFEMYGPAQEVIRGKISPALDETAIIALNRNWSGLSCVAHMRVVRVLRTGAPEQVRYTLLRVAAQDTAGHVSA